MKRVSPAANQALSRIPDAPRAGDFLRAGTHGERTHAPSRAAAGFIVLSAYSKYFSGMNL